MRVAKCPLTRRVGPAIAMAGMVLAGAAFAGEFRAQARLEPIDLRNVQTPAAGVEQVVVSALLGTASSTTASQLDSANVTFFATSIVPSDARPHVFGYTSFRSADGSLLHLYWEGEPSKWREDKVGRGTWSVLGGTETFDGAAGTGSYTFSAKDGGPVQTFEGDITLK